MRKHLFLLVCTGLGVPGAVAAQCADGTPPPCGVSTRPVVVTAPPPAAERGRSFLVLPFRNVTRAADTEWLIEGSPALLSDALAQWDEVSVVPAERLYPALRRQGLEPGAVMDADRVRRVAEQTGGWTAVTGDILATGNRVRVSARAYDVTTGEVVVRATEEMDAEGDIREVYERLAGRLLETAGVDAPSPNLPRATTQSLDAYKAYLQGLALYHRGRMESAHPLFEEAVALDSMFAQAYAKLAETSMTSIEALLDPQSPGYRYAERAASLSARLPERERQHVAASVAMFRGQLGHARELLNELVASDSNDVEALENLADLYMFDPVVVTEDSVERLRASFNMSARLAKRALALDGERHGNLGTLIAVYARAGGQYEGRTPGVRGERPSMPELLRAMNRPDRVFATVLRDTFEFVPAESLVTMPADTLRALRRRAISTAVAWAERWLAAAPGDAPAHQAAVDVYTLAERYDDALRELAIADSIGLEVSFGRATSERMEILTRAGRYDEAGGLVDSLIAAGDYGRERMMSDQLVINDLGWIFNLRLLQGRPALADSLLRSMVAFVQSLRPDADSSRLAHNYLFVFARRTDAAGPPNVVMIPEYVRRHVVDSLIAHIYEIPDSSEIGLHVLDAVNLSTQGAADSVRAAYAGRLHAHAGRLLDEGRIRLAVQTAIQGVLTDTSVASLDRQYETLRRVLDIEPDNFTALYQVGRYAARSGKRLEEGRAALERYVAEATPGSFDVSVAGAHWRLGMIAEHRGDRAAAREEYERALAADPDFANARRALDRLNQSEP